MRRDRREDDAGELGIAARAHISPDGPEGLAPIVGTRAKKTDDIAGPVPDEETILLCDVDLSDIARESLTLDVTAHYARPDIFDVHLKAETGEPRD